MQLDHITYKKAIPIFTRGISNTTDENTKSNLFPLPLPFVYMQV